MSAPTPDPTVRAFTVWCGVLQRALANRGIAGASPEEATREWFYHRTPHQAAASIDANRALEEMTDPDRTAAPTPGERPYREDCRRKPSYHNGAPRKSWAELQPWARDSWERDPAPRSYRR